MLPDLSRETWILIGVVVGLIAIVTLYGAVRLLMKVVQTRRHLGELGPGGKIAFWGALIYTVFPLDILPDPIYLDDMAVLGTALAVLTRLWRKRHGNLPIPRTRGKLPDRPKATTQR
jgi:4-amino-4-deoxy-L-arabinose transferase-like glycosyltransferase